MRTYYVALNRKIGGTWEVKPYDNKKKMMHDIEEFKRSYQFNKVKRVTRWFVSKIYGKKWYISWAFSIDSRFGEGGYGIGSIYTKGA